MPSQASWEKAGRTQPRIVVLASVNRPRVKAELDGIVHILSKSAEIVAVDQDESFRFTSTNELDMCVVLGGDGSILSAARRMGLHQLPVIGVNLGSLGFLAALGEKELSRVWPEICEGKFPIDEHVMLACTIIRKSNPSQSESGYQLALNEASILGGAPFSMIQIDLYVDGELASTYSCDGLIISTPVGSTAHNLSAGGPILARWLQAVVISPISPHTLTMRPVVDRADRCYEMYVRHGHASVSAVFDGRVLGNLDEGDCYRVTKAPVSFKMINIPGKGEYRTLREKLGWGGNPRENRK
ncbi:MAG: NAD(+)/NADH kinase [Planctomycetales bacterium]|nr:NAD(+)/NADH kinase [Planctomycetales bacterium]